MATNCQLSINNGNKSPIINQQWQQISNFQLTMATNRQFINNGNQFMLSHRFQMFFRQEVKDLKEIGRGNFGVVSSGKWRDTDVAVKVFLTMATMMMMIIIIMATMMTMIINMIMTPRLVFGWFQYQPLLSKI